MYNKQGNKDTDKNKADTGKQTPAEKPVVNAYTKHLQDEEAAKARAAETVKASFLRNILYVTPKTGPDKDRLMERPAITDISFNGTDIHIQDNDKGRYKLNGERDPRMLAGEDPISVIPSDVTTLGSSISNSKQESWTSRSPILDVEIGDLRTNFMNDRVAPYGQTFALRVSRPSLAVKNIAALADEDTEQLLRVFMMLGLNLLISGVTGSGKTELQKALVGFIPDSKKITLMEDTLDSHIKEIYPQKDINSWGTSANSESPKDSVGFPELIKAGLRNNPDWLMISEVRGSEAQDLLAAALTGHSIMTTIHANGASSIPSRLSNMVAQSATSTNFEALQLDIVSVLNLGLHMEMHINPVTQKISRDIREICEYREYRQGMGIIAAPIFQRTVNYNPTTKAYSETLTKRRLSQKLLTKITNAHLIHLVPAVFKEGPETDALTASKELIN